jgi:hypothetical protein
MKLEAVRIDRTMQGDREVKLPYKCFACHDGGLAGGRFVNEFVDGNSDIPFICNRDYCEAGRLRRTAWSANNDETYRASFDVRLDKYACEDIHNWEKDHFVQTVILRPKQVDIASQYVQAVSDRQQQIEDIKDLLMSVESDIRDRIENFVKRYRDKDNVLYRSWEDLPTEAQGKLLVNIRNLAA